MNISKNHIVKILKESTKDYSKFYKIANNEKLVRNTIKYLEIKLMERKEDYESIEYITELDPVDNRYLHNVLMKQMGYSYDEANFFIAILLVKYTMSLSGYSDELGNLLYKVDSDDKIPFLKASGYYDDMMTNIRNTFDDIEFQGDKVLLEVSGWYDFANEGFFGRGTNDQHIAELVLSEDFVELFDLPWNVDSLEECIEHLNAENRRKLMEIIISERDEIFVGYEGDRLRDFFEDNEFDLTYVDGYINTEDNKETLLRIMEPLTMVNIIMDGDLDGIRGDLLRLYSSSYNSAAEDEVFNDLKNEIESFLGSEGKWENSVLVFDITENFRYWLDDFITLSDTNPIHDFNNYLDFLGEYISGYNSEINYGLDAPNLQYFYPDSKKISEYINDSFNEYMDL
jgi:hypothetical protein